LGKGLPILVATAAALVHYLVSFVALHHFSASKKVRKLPVIIIFLLSVLGGQ